MNATAAPLNTKEGGPGNIQETFRKHYPPLNTKRLPKGGIHTCIIIIRHMIRAICQMRDALFIGGRLKTYVKETLLAERKVGRPKQLSGNIQETLPSPEYEKAPQKGNTYISNNNKQLDTCPMPCAS